MWSAMNDDSEKDFDFVNLIDEVWDKYFNDICWYKKL